MNQDQIVSVLLAAARSAVDVALWEVLEPVARATAEELAREVAEEARKPSATRLNEETLYREVMRQGSTLREFDPTSISHIRRCIQARLLEPEGKKTKTGQAWKLTDAGKEAVRRQHQQDLDRWQNRFDYFTSKIGQIYLGQGVHVRVSHEKWATKWIITPQFDEPLTIRARAQAARRDRAMLDRAYRQIETAIFNDRHFVLYANDEGDLVVELTDLGKKHHRLDELAKTLAFRI